MFQWYSNFIELLPQWLKPFVNGVVIFHILTFVVWAIIFAKDLMVPAKHPLTELKKKQ